MSRLSDRPPLRLESFKASYLRLKLDYIQALLRWCQHWLNEVQDMSRDAAFDGLATAKRTRRLASSVEKTFEDIAIAAMYQDGEAIHQGDGYMAILRTGTERKAWKHAEVMTALVDATVQVMIDRHPYVPEKIMRAIVTESMWRVHKCGRVEWRATDLRSFGVDPDAYSTKSRDEPSLDLRGEASYTQTHRRPRGLAHV